MISRRKEQAKGPVDDDDDGDKYINKGRTFILISL